MVARQDYNSRCLVDKARESLPTGISERVRENRPTRVHMPSKQVVAGSNPVPRSKAQYRRQKRPGPWRPRGSPEPLPGRQIIAGSIATPPKSRETLLSRIRLLSGGQRAPRMTLDSAAPASPCQCFTPGGIQTTSPGSKSRLSPPHSRVQPMPDVTIRVWPAGWLCHALRAPGSNMTWPPVARV
jgi:hypothetical protein